MIKNINEFYYPRTVKECLSLIQKYKDKSSLLAGGTSLVLRPPKNISVIISLKNLPLKNIKNDGKKVTVEAMATLSDIMKSGKLKDNLGKALKQASAKAASTPVRNLISAGGNITQVYSWSNLPLVLLAADMKINVAGKTKKKISARDFFKKHPKQILGKDEIVTSFEYNLPKDNSKIYAAFDKFSLTVNDYSLLSFCVFIKVKNKKIAEAGIAAGAASAIPQIMKNTEKYLIGQDIKKIEEIAAEAGKIALSEIEPKPDMRISSEYKKEITETLVRRLILEALKK